MHSIMSELLETWCGQLESRKEKEKLWGRYCELQVPLAFNVKREK